MEEKETEELSAHHQAFADEYVVDFNGKQAYIRVYPDCAPDSANASASRLLSNVNVLEAIGKAIEAKKQRCQIDQDYLISHWMDRVEAPKNHVELETVQVKRGEDKDAKTGYQTYRAPDRDKALIELGKLTGAYPNKSQIEHSGGLDLKHDKWPNTKRHLEGFKD